MTTAGPRLCGVIHLPPLPGSPRCSAGAKASAELAARDAEVLAEAGFDAVMVENFGDAPFFPERAPAVTVAAMTRCALAVRAAAPELVLGINVLRNDAEAALAVAAASEAAMVRINVHAGARLTDQGVVRGRAHETLRLRRSLGLEHVTLWCDVDVKHAAPLAPRPIAEEATELVGRALADAVLVTGHGTGAEADRTDLDAVLAAVEAPVYVASGVTVASLPGLLSGRQRPHGVIVGSCLRASGRAGEPIDQARARAFAEAFEALRS